MDETLQVTDTITLEGVTVAHEVGGYTTPDGFYHPTGVHRIRATVVETGLPYQGKVYQGRAKTFRGETAWMKAEGLFSDIVWELRRKARW